MIIVDTGPLVALLDQHDPDHVWAKQTITGLPAPLLTCEPVITETAFLVSKSSRAIIRLFDLIRANALAVDFSIANETDHLKHLMVKYHDLPMSLADACLVRMTEKEPDSRILTIDSHFRIYRRNHRDEIPVIMPA